MKWKLIILMLGIILVSAEGFAFTILRAKNGAEIHWEETPTYYINPDSINNDTTKTCVADPTGTVQEAFNKWLSIPNTSISVSYGGTSGVIHFCGEILHSDTGCDGVNIIIFSKSSIFVSGTLALTVNKYDPKTGKIVETDIGINDKVDWSDDPTESQIDGCTGDTIYAFSAVITHELGHFFGLDHSFIGYYGPRLDKVYADIAPTMFPFYFKDYWEHEMSLEQDDKAGLVYLYPGSEPTGWGNISGKVKLDSGEGLFGVHIVALRKDDKTPVIGAMSEPNGNYLLYGLPPGDYYVFAESPEIKGRSISNLLVQTGYWKNIDEAPYVQLYEQVQVEDYTRLGKGSTIFERAEVKAVSVSEGATSSGVDFIYPSPGDDGGGCGCWMVPGKGAGVDIVAGLAMVIIFSVWLRAMLKRRGGING